MSDTVRTRFAPSPTGYLHIGGLRTALYSYLYAKKTGGKFILRIEDTDQGRYVEGATEKILSALKETGLAYDEGPDIGGPYAPYVQSQRKNEYMGYALELVGKGAAYYCFCSKERLESLPEIGGARRYDKHCLNLSKEEITRRLNSGEPFVIRQNMPASGSTTYHDSVYGDITVANSELEDQVLIKSDGMPTYNFANVIDDHLMDINCVMRGNEYLSSTPKYNLLYDAFGWKKPVYIHMPQIMRDAQHKLSKRNGDAAYSDFIERGYLKEAVLNYIALLGWSPKNNLEKMTVAEMEELFSIEGINKSPAIFDPAKMGWLNGLYIKEMPFDEFVSYAKPFLDKTKIAGKYDYLKICRLVQGRIEYFGEIGEKVNFLEEFGEYGLSLFINEKQKCGLETAKFTLPLAKNALSGIENWENSVLYETLQGLAKSQSLKNSQILWPVRVALSGRESTPGGATELAELLGKTESLRRLEFSINLLNSAK